MRGEALGAAIALAGVTLGAIVSRKRHTSNTAPSKTENTIYEYGVLSPFPAHSKLRHYWLWTIFTIVISTLAWASTPFWLRYFHSHFQPADDATKTSPVDKIDFASLGQFGDMFGSINALFSALALAGVLVSLWYQMHAINIQHRSTKESTWANSFSVVHGILQSQCAINARKIVLSDSPDAIRNIHFAQWDKTQIDAAERVCRDYDFVGIMVRENMLPESYIINSWAASLDNSWSKLEKFVEDKRANQPDLWRDFQRLGTMAKKIQSMRQSH